MEKYTYYMDKAYYCDVTGEIYYNLKQFNLAKFYRNAAQGYRIKANNLTLGELRK